MTEDTNQVLDGKKECLLPGCNYESRYDSDDPLHDERRAEEEVERHFDRTHRGTVRVQVTLEQEVSIHPKQEPGDLADRAHERMEDADLPAGFELAYVAARVDEEADEWSDSE